MTIWAIWLAPELIIWCFIAPLKHHAQHQHGHNIITVIWFPCKDTLRAARQLKQCDINAVVVANLKPGTVLLSLNVPLNFVYIISWVMCYAVWTIHEGPHGIFMGAPVQLGLIPHPWLHRCRFDVIRVGLRRINTQTIHFKHLIVKHILTWLILGEYATTFHFSMQKFCVTIFNQSLYSDSLGWFDVQLPIWFACASTSVSQHSNKVAVEFFKTT